MKLNLGAGNAPLDGFVNLDAFEGWRFQDGLDYPTASVNAISISHALMFLSLEDWPPAFAEFARVLVPGGVIRITEDNTTDPLSERFGGHAEAVALTSAELVIRHLETAGFSASEVAPDQTSYLDDSLLQWLHGNPPKVFFVEGIR